MRKLFLSFVLLGFTAASFADECPVLTGKYVCMNKGGEVPMPVGIEVTMPIVHGRQAYKFENMSTGAYELWEVNPVPQPYTTDTNHGWYKIMCADNKLKTLFYDALNEPLGDDHEKPLGDATLTQELYLDENGGLVRTNKGKVLLFGVKEYPVDSKATCPVMPKEKLTQ